MFRTYLFSVSNSLLIQQSYSVVVNTICFAISAVTIFLVAGVLGPEQFGVVGILLAVLGIASAIQHLGINAGVTKLIAVSGNEEQSFYIIKNALVLKLAIVLATGLALFLLKNSIVFLLQRPYIEDYFIYVALILVFSELSMFFESIVFALHRANRALNIRLVVAILKFIAIILCAANFGVEGFFYSPVF